MVGKLSKRRKTTLSIPDLKVHNAIDQLKALIDDAAKEANGGKDVLPARPAGSFSMQEYAASRAISMDTANGQLMSLVRAGKYERVLAYGHIPTQNLAGRSRRVLWFYRPTGKGDVAPR